MNSQMPKADVNEIQQEALHKAAWEKPEIVSYTPAKNAQGVSYRPLDGISNLS